MSGKPSYGDLEKKVQALERALSQSRQAEGNTRNDTTCRSETKDSLRGLVEQQEAIFETAMVGIMVLHNRMITKVNRRLTEILGYSSEEMLYRGPEQLHLSYEHFVDFGEKYYWRLSEKTIVQAEYPLRHKDGHTVWCLFSGKAIVPPDLGEGAVWIIDDISSQKQAQRDLELSLAHLHTTLDATADGILVVDRKGKTVFFSKRFAEMWGLPADILEKKDDDLMLAFAAGQVVDPEGFLAKIKTLYAEPEAKIVDTVQFEDGRIFERHSHPQRLNGEVIGRVWSFRDVTDRAQAEKALQDQRAFLSELIEAMPIPLYYKDLDGRYLGFNAAFETFFGQEREQLIGKTVFDIHPPALAGMISQKDYELFEKGGFQQYELQLVNNKGGRHEAVFDKSVFTDRLGEVRGLIGTIMDITDRKQVEAKERQLEKAESLSRMAGAVAHHFNNMLAVTIGNLELVLEDLPQEHSVYRSLVEAEQAALRAAEMSRLMLAYLGQTPGKSRLLDLSDICRRYLEISGPDTSEGLILHTQFQHPGPIIRADRSQVEQILNALLTNALEAFETMDTIDQACITLSTVTIEASAISETHRFPTDWTPSVPTYASLSVMDNAGGMDQATIGRIFDPFFTDKAIGRGLGLPVILGIIKAHGGCITVNSAPGGGSVFTVFLPPSNQQASI